MLSPSGGSNPPLPALVMSQDGLVGVGRDLLESRPVHPRHRGRGADADGAELDVVVRRVALHAGHLTGARTRAHTTAIGATARPCGWVRSAIGRRQRIDGTLGRA